MKVVFPALFALILAVLSPTSLQAQQYTVLPLNMGASYGALNNAGQVIGQVGIHAVLTRPDSAFNPATDYLDTSAGISQGLGLNDLGEAAGTIDLTDGTPQPTRGTRSLPNSPYNLSQSNFGTNAPYAINNSGQTTGMGNDTFAFRSSGDGQPLTFTSLGSLGGTSIAGGSVSLGQAINNNGVVTGWSLTAGNTARHAFRSAGSSINPATDDLGVLGTGIFSQGFGINDAGVVIGKSDISSTSGAPTHAFRAVPGQAMQDLGTLGGSNSDAFGINSQGWIVGRSELFSGEGTLGAFLWHDGVMYNLSQLVDPAHPFAYGQALDINDNGQILARGADGGLFLFTPTPEPSTIILLSLGISACFICRIRYKH
jgi:probable HAF family extracellular repeat protein